jgi:cytochrome c553
MHKVCGWRSGVVRALGWVLFLIALVACGAAPDPERGRQLYMGERAFSDGSLACIECHPVNPGERSQVMGQDLSNIGNRAAETVAGQSAEQYLRAAIIDPRTYAEALSDGDVADLVAYMLTLQSGQDP